MVVNRRIALSREVEVGVVGEVEHRCLVGRCFVSDSKVVGDRAETIGHLHLEFAWIPLLSIFRYVGENQL